MKTGYWFDQLPLWAVFILAAAIVWLPVLAGAFIARRRRQNEQAPDASLATVCAAMLGLLAFMLAFTFGFTAERFQAARLFLLQEVNAIETTSLRARLLPPPYRDQVPDLLRRYVDIRVEMMQDTSPAGFAAAVAQSEQLQSLLWSHAVALSQADRYSPIDALFISSLNEMIDLQTSRITVFAYRVPPALWECLFFIAILSMFATGYQIGLASSRGVIVGLLLALTFASVILLIADLDRAGQGRLRVGQQPMLDLQSRLHAAS